MENSQWVTEEEPKSEEPNSPNSAQPQTANSVVTKPIKPKGKLRWVWLVIVILVVSGIAAVLLNKHKTSLQSTAQNKIPKTQSINLSNISSAATPFQLDNKDRVVINGLLNVNQGIVLKPAAPPSSLSVGQLYVDKSNSTLYFYDGKTSTPVVGDGVPTPAPTVTSLQGQTGAVTLVGGAGVAINGTTISNTGALSVQGQTGNVTFSAGAGIGISGTSFANTGVLSLQGQTGAVSLSGGSGVNISGTSIGVDSSVARLDSNGNDQIFTGTGQIFRNSTDSLTGFTVQTAAGAQLLTVDTSANQVIFGQAGSLNGKLAIATAGNGTITLVPTSTAGNFTITLPNATGTICLDSGNCSSSGANTALSNLSGVAINTSLLPGTAGIVNLGSGTLPFGQLYIAGTSSNPDTNNFLFTGVSTGGTRTFTLPDASGTICIASGNCLSGSGGGARNDLSNLQSVAINTSLLPGVAGTVHLGSASLPFGQLYLSGTSSSPATNKFFITGASTGGTRTITLPDATGTVCLDTTCAAGATRALDNLQGVAINTTLLPGTAGVVDLGSSSLPFGKLSLAGASTNPDVNNFLLTGTSTSGTRTITLPDASGILCLTTTCGGGSGGANTALSNLASVAINTTLLPGSATGIDLGSATLPFSHLYVAGDSSTPGTNNFLITGASSSGTRTITLPDASGTICLDTTACGGGGGGGGANTSLSNLSAVAVNTSLLPGVSNSISIGSSSFLFQNGYFGTGLTTPLLQSTGALNITPGGTLTVGAASQALTLQGNGFTALKVTDSGVTNQIVFAAPSAGNKTITVPNLSGTVCLTAQNCLGGVGGGAKDDLSNLQSVAINTSLLPGVAGAISVGSATMPFGQLFLSGTSSTPGTNNFLLTGVSTGGTRTLTLPDASGTICISTGNCLGGGSGGANTSLSNLQSVAINTSLLPGSNVIDIGTSSGTTFRSGYFGTGLTAPLLQSTGTLNITSGGTLMAGSTTQTLTLQGDAATSLSATSGGVTNQLVFATPSGGGKFLTLPNETGTICTNALATSACVVLQGSSPGTAQTGHLNISGTAILGVSTLTPILDTPTAAALTIGNTNATAINIGKSGSNIVTTITGQTIVKPSTGNDTATGFQVQNAAGTTILSADTRAQSSNINFVTTCTGCSATDSSFETASNTTTHWTGKGSAVQPSTDNTQAKAGSRSLKVITTAAALDGAKLTASGSPNLLTSFTPYTLSMFIRVPQFTTTLTDVVIGYSNDSTDTTNCVAQQSVVGSGWTQFVCAFTTGVTTANSSVFVKKTGTTAETFYIDQVELYDTSGPKLTIGSYNGSQANSLTGQLSFISNGITGGGSITLQASPSTIANYILSLPNESGTICTDNPGSACSIAGDGKYLSKISADTASINTSGAGYLFKNAGAGSVLRLQGNSTTAFVVQNAANTIQVLNADTTNDLVTITGALAILPLDTSGTTISAAAGNVSNGDFDYGVTATYFYKVIAKDAAGNASAPTTEDSVANTSFGLIPDPTTTPTLSLVNNGVGGCVGSYPSGQVIKYKYVYETTYGLSNVSPTSATITTTAANQCINVSFNIGGSAPRGTTHINVYRSGNGNSTFGKIQVSGACALVQPSATTCLDNGVSNGGAAPPSSNTGHTATNVISLTITNASSNIASYDVYRSTTTNAEQFLTNVTRTGTSTIFSDLNSGTPSGAIPTTSSNHLLGIGTASPTADLSFADGVTGTIRSINVLQQSVTNGGGNRLNIIAGMGNGTGQGGLLFLQGGGGDTSATGNGAGGGVNIQGGTASSGSGKNGGTITIDSGIPDGAGTSTINIGQTNATAINISTTGAGSTAINIGGAGATGSLLSLEGSTAATGILIGASNNNHGIKIGTGTGTQTVLLGSTSGASATTISSGSGGVSIQGATTFSNAATFNTNILFSNTVGHFILVNTSIAGNFGQNLTISAGKAGAGGGASGNLTLNGGTSGGATGDNAGNVVIQGGSAFANPLNDGASGGTISLTGGTGPTFQFGSGPVATYFGAGIKVNGSVGLGFSGGDISIAGGGFNDATYGGFAGAVHLNGQSTIIRPGFSVPSTTTCTTLGLTNVDGTNNVCYRDTNIAFQIQNAQGTTLLNVDTTNNTFSIGASGANSNTLQLASAVTGSNTASVTIGSNNAAASFTLLQGGNGTGASAAIRLIPNNAGDILIGGSGQTGAITVGQSTASQTINIGTGVTASGNTLAIHVGDAGASGSTTNLTIGSTVGGTTTLQSGGGIVLSTLGTANNVNFLCRNASNIIATCSTSGSGASFVQGGNTFGATAVLGTNDNNGLNIRTNSTTVASLSSTGAALFQNSTNSANAFQIQNALGSNTVFNVDTSNNRIGINTTSAATADITFGDTADRTVNVLSRTTNAAGNTLTVQAGNAGSGATAFVGGNLILQAGSAAGTSGNANGGSVVVRVGGGVNSGLNGTFDVVDSLGNPYFRTQRTGGSTTTSVTCGTSLANTCEYTAGLVGGNGATSNDLRLLSGVASGTNSISGSVSILTGNASGTTTTSGNITIGTGTATGTAGKVIFKNGTNSTNAFQFQTSSGTSLLGIDTTGSGALTLGNSGGTLTVNSNSTFNGTLTVNGNSTFNGHIITANSSGSTSVAVGTIATCVDSTHGSVAISGNDTSGTVTITTDATGPCATGGLLATVTFANSYGSAPRVILTPADTNAATLQYYNNTSGTTSFTIDSNTAPTAGGTIYKYNYLVVE